MHMVATRDIARPADEVFAFLSDSSNSPRWQRGMERCTWTSAPPIGVGSTYDQVARFLGKRILSHFEVVLFEPGRVIEIQSVDGTFPIRVRRAVEPLGDDFCRVAVAIDGEPGGLLGLLGTIAQRMAQRSVDADYDRLVQSLEESTAL